MSDTNRRQVVQAASVLGGAVLLGATARVAAAADDSKKLVPLVLEKEEVVIKEKQAEAMIEAIATTDGFCDKWKATIRPILIAAVAVLTIIRPAAAAALKKVISYVDTVCGMA